MLRVLSALRLTQLTVHPDSGIIYSATNLTLLNALLVWFGPMRERTLTMCCAGIQVLGTCAAFAVRYGLVGVFYDGDRR